MVKKNRRSSNSRKPAKVARESRSEREFNPDYTEIKSDLKRIGLLAGMFLAILIALSFVL
ncbi:MAG: hypothetical protein HN855_02485 [Anaerolineae bacterium]|jgi:hypothetical protein|nr:hypothetical protein [Anaerolineae bacterium]MBT7072012.1 hypothetical protein [Anaerolineae bacterium]MBT7324008.1 hypothetical protein [Anaerolineae bacterium]